MIESFKFIILYFYCKSMMPPNEMNLYHHLLVKLLISWLFIFIWNAISNLQMLKKKKNKEKERKNCRQADACFPSFLM